MDKGIIFFCLDISINSIQVQKKQKICAFAEASAQAKGTGLLLGSETIYLNCFYTNRTISPPPEPLFCR
jgi:hypothetical protein